jgi:hypothetical protein
MADSSSVHSAPKHLSRPARAMGISVRLAFVGAERDPSA